VVPEAARAVIDAYRSRGIPVEKLRTNEIKFQQEVLDMKLKTEAGLSGEHVYLFDRGVPDSIAYYRFSGLETERIEACSAGRYRMVFFMEPLRFEVDYARVESAAEAMRLHQLLLEAYRDFGYEIVKIPPVPVDERVRLVLPFLRR
jgi:predicted ATPase